MPAIFFPASRNSLPVGIIRTDTIWINSFKSQIYGKYGGKIKHFSKINTDGNYWKDLNKWFFSQWTKVISLISAWGICKEADLVLHANLKNSY